MSAPSGLPLLPRSRVDGDPVTVFAGNVHSFVYVDNSLTQEQLEQALNTPGFTGYRLLWKRPVLSRSLTRGTVRKCDLFTGMGMGVGMQGERPPTGGRFGASSSASRIAAKITVLRVSVCLYICDDGVAAYNSLFNAQLMRPAMLALFCCPGYGRGGNWTTYVRRDMGLALTVFRNQAGPPSFLLLDGPHGTRCDWPHYDCSSHKREEEDPLHIEIPQSVGGTRRYIDVRRLGSPRHLRDVVRRKIRTRSRLMAAFDCSQGPYG